jgi:Mg2+-importing ATPase
VLIGAALPLSPLSHTLGFMHLPWDFFLALAGMVVGYLVLIELAKRLFFAEREAEPSGRQRGSRHRVQRRAARFSVSAR